MLITTSRKPGLKTKAFARDLTRSFPNAVYFSRGKRSLQELFGEADYKGIRHVLIVQEKDGNPIVIQCIELGKKTFVEIFSLKISVIKLRREINKDKSIQKKNFTELKLIISTPSIKKVFELVEIESTSDADFTLKEDKNILSFFDFNDAEIGPRFKVNKITFKD